MNGLDPEVQRYLNEAKFWTYVSAFFAAISTVAAIIALVLKYV